jgi:hypothetical protein
MIKENTQTLFSFVKWLLGSAKFKPFKPIAPRHNSAVILGNGPSLREYLPNLLELSTRVDFWGVNFFCNSEAFENLKPRYYVVNAPELVFLSEGAIPHKTLEAKKELLANISKADWPMQLFVPYPGVKAMKRQFQNHIHIKVQGYNATPLEGSVKFTNFALRHGWGLPRPHNVLIPALALALRMDFAKILLLGAEHSWIETLTVTQDNEVLLDHQHFYDKGKQIDKMNSSTFEPRKLHEVLEKFYFSFKSYWVLKYFASHLNTQVYNVTPKSYIDAFKKVDINDVQF